MPLTRKSSSSNPFTTAIDKFIEYMKTNKESSLTQIILYLMCSKEVSQLCLVGNAEPVVNVRNYCDTNIPAVRTQFLNALTTACADYFLPVPFDKIIDEKHPVGNIVAAFHKNAESHFAKEKSSNKKEKSPLALNLNLNKLANLSESKREVILFCIKRFVPELIISGPLVNPTNELTLLSEIVTAYTISTSFTYQHCDFSKLAPVELQIWLKSLGKANELVLKDMPLDQWSEDHFKQFVIAVRANPQLTVLNLKHTRLDKCCASVSKFQSLLELISLPQFKNINLHMNHLSKLPPVQLKQLKDAIHSTPPAEAIAGKKSKSVVHIHLKESKKSRAGVQGMFVPVTTTPTPVAQNTPPSLSNM